jgi:hypothetical protein
MRPHRISKKPNWETFTKNYETEKQTSSQSLLIRKWHQINDYVISKQNFLAESSESEAEAQSNLNLKQSKSFLKLYEWGQFINLECRLRSVI